MDVGGQRGLFHEEGRDLLTDYWMPQTCLVEGYAEVGDRMPSFNGVKHSGWVDGKMCVASFDRCYPAFALLPFRLFPATWAGAWAWTILSALALTGVLCVMAHSLWPLVLLCSMPVLFNIDRGNPVVLTAALVGVFLVWYRSETRWKRVAAALAISAATCLKISPVVLGALYLRERDWKGIGLCAVFTCFLFFVPWFMIPCGLSGLPLMIANACEHSSFFSRVAEFGLVGIWRTLRVALHQDCTHVWPGCLVAVRISQALGFAMVAWGAWKRNILWAVVGMLWAAGNMHYYGALYLLPVFVLTISFSRSTPTPVHYTSLLLWFVILCPFQFVVMGHSANGILCNLASLTLLLTQGNGNADVAGNG